MEVGVVKINNSNNCVILYLNGNNCVILYLGPGSANVAKPKCLFHFWRVRTQLMTY